MFNQLKKKGGMLSGHDKTNYKIKKRREYLLRKRQQLMLQQAYLHKQKLKFERLNQQQTQNQLVYSENIVEDEKVKNIEETQSILEISNKNKQKLNENNVKTGVVITTHGYYGIFARQCLQSFERELPENYFIVLFINESQDEITLNLIEKYENNEKIVVIYNEDQHKSGGLTGTWNKGIDLCLENNCDVVVLSNDDILFDGCINNILWSCYENKEKMQYFGPISNNPGPKNCAINMCQYGVKPIDNKNKIALYNDNLCNLNGFFMVFSKKVLIENKFDNNFYFDPEKPFGGNETEWFNRFKDKKGEPIIVPQTFIYHYKIARWREGNKENNTCIYTINTGSYEGTKVYLKKSNIDTLYFTDNFDCIYNCINKELLPFYIDTRGKDPKLIQRTVKTNPTLFLPYNYEKSIYIDGNMFLKNYNYLNYYLNFLENHDVVCFKHPERNFVLDEAKKVIDFQLERKDNVEKIVKEMKKNNFKDNEGLCETGILLRNHKKIINFNKDWCRCINICRRDQVSFDYILHKNNINYVKHEHIEKWLIINRVEHLNPVNRTIM